MFAVLNESNHAQLEQFPFIQSALLTQKMLTHEGECLRQRQQTLQYLLFVVTDEYFINISVQT